MKNEPEIRDAVVKIQEQLISLNKKVDVLMMRALVTSPSTPTVQKPIEKQNYPNAKPMYTIICADCKKESSLPFKPSGDRPVYCKECFSKRRSGGGNLIQVAPPVQIVKESIVSAPPVKENKKKTPAKKTIAKKKPAAKKKKK